MPAVKVSEIPPCIGPEKDKECQFKHKGSLDRYAGMDGKWRCADCQMIHMTLVYSEYSTPGDKKPT